MADEIERLRSAPPGELTSGQLTVLVAELEKRLEQRFNNNDKALEAALAAAKEAVSAALAAAKEAVDKAEASYGKRFESVNEFRNQLADQAASFMPRKEADLQFDVLTRAVAEIRSEIADIRGRGRGLMEQERTGRAESTMRIAVAAVTVSLIIGIAGILVAVIGSR